MAARLSPRATARRSRVESNNKFLSWLDEVSATPASDTAKLAELREEFRRKRPAEVPPTAVELARRELAQRLRNLEALCDEVRELVNAAGSAASVDLLGTLSGTCRELEVALSAACEAAAESAGLVAT